MKVKKVSINRKVLPPTPEVAEAIHRIMQTSPENLANLLLALSENTPEWRLGRSDLHNWIPVLDRFDSIMANYHMYDKDLLLSVLAFDKLLLENCSSRNLFNSYDSLNNMLTSHDLEVLESALELLMLPARKLEAHRHLLKTYSDNLDLKRLKLFADLLLPEELNSELEALQLIHRGFQHTPDPEGRYLHVKLMSLFILLMLDTNTYDSSHSAVFSVNPLLIGQIVALITNEDKYPSKPVASAIYVLRACIKYEFKGQELSNALQLHSSHGLFMTRLRKINQGFKSGEVEYSPYYLTGFTDLLFRLCSTPEFDAELLNLGILQELVSAVETSLPKFYKHVEKYLYAMDSVVAKLIGTMDVFIGSADGLNVIVRMIGRLASQESELEASFLSVLLKLLEKILLCHGSDERLRNLVETPLFAHLKTIFSGTQKSPEVLSRAMTVMSTFIHNEPNTLTIVQEAGLPGTFLQMLCDRGLPHHSDFLGKIFTALSALCLNPNGLAQVQQMNPFKSIFACFLDRSFSRHLLSHGTSTQLGQAIDEFIRHHPAFKDQICDEIISMLKNLPETMTLAAMSDPKFNTLSPISDESDEYEVVSMVSWDMEDVPSALLFEGVVSMLETLIQNPTHFEELRKRQLVPLVAKCLTVQLPFDFVASQSAHVASHLFRVITESPDNNLLETLLDLFDEAYMQLHLELFESDLSINDRLPQLNAALQSLISVSNILDLLCEVHINSIQGHLRTMASWTKLIQTRESTLRNILDLACRIRHLYNLLERRVPQIILKTALHFKGRDWERPIGVILDHTFPEDLPFIDPQDPRVYNVRKIATIQREILDSIVALYSAISASSSLAGRKTTPEEEVANQQLLTVALNHLLTEACQSPPDEALASTSLAFFFVDCILFEDLSSKVSLLTTPLKPLVSCSQLFVNAISKISQTTEDINLAVSVFLSIAHSLLDPKSYRSNTWDDLTLASDKNLQCIFEMIAQCCLILIQSRAKFNDSKANFLQLLSLLADPTWVLPDPNKPEVRQLSMFISACKSPDISHCMAEPANIHWMHKFDKSDMNIVQDFARQNVNLSPMAVAATLDSSNGNLDKLTDFPKDQLIQLVLGMLYFNLKRAIDVEHRSQAVSSVLPSFMSLMKIDPKELNESAVSAILLGFSLIIVASNETLPLDEFWSYGKNFWNTDSLDVRQALFQFYLALIIKSPQAPSPSSLIEFMFGNFDVLGKMIKTTDMDPKDVELGSESHQSIIHLLILVIRISIEKSTIGSDASSLKPYATELIESELCSTFKREFLFEELFSDRIMAGAILHPDAFVESFKKVFTVVDPTRRFASIEAYRQHLDRELRLKLKKETPSITTYDQHNELMLAIVDFFYKDFSNRTRYNKNYGYCALTLILCELCTSYPNFLMVFLKDARLEDLIAFMLDNLTPASPYEIPAVANDPKFANRVLELKEKMINRAWCQYFLGSCLSGCWRNEEVLGIAVKHIVASLVGCLKKCFAAGISCSPVLYGLADTLYHLLTFGISSTSNLEEQASRQIISKLVMQLVESKVAILMTMILRTFQVQRVQQVQDENGNLILLWRELVRGKVVRFLELMTRYGNRLKRIKRQAPLTNADLRGSTIQELSEADEGEEEEVTDEEGYESFDEEDDLPMNEEEEMLAQVESAQDEMMSVGEDEEDMFMSLDDEGEEDEDRSSSTLDEDTEGEDEMYDAIGEDVDEDEDMIVDDEEDMLEQGDEGESETEIEYEIEIEPVHGHRRRSRQGESEYLLSPEDVDLRANTGTGRTISRFITRLLDSSARQGADAENIPLDVEEEYDDNETEGRPEPEEHGGETEEDHEDNELEALAAGRDQDAGGEDQSEYYYSEEPALEFEIQTSAGPGVRRRRYHQGEGLFASLQARSQTGAAFRRMFDMPSYASALSGPTTLPSHPLLAITAVPQLPQLQQQQQQPPSKRSAEGTSGLLSVLITPISVSTGKRWQQAVNVFKMLPSSTFKEGLRSQLVDQACVSFVPSQNAESTKVKSEQGKKEDKREYTSTDTAEDEELTEEEIDAEMDEVENEGNEATEDSSSASSYMSSDNHDEEYQQTIDDNLRRQREAAGSSGEEVVYEDPGADVSFLTALPFDMRAEVLEQHFEQRHTLMPVNTTRIVINPAFLQALPEDLRDDYCRMSEEDLERLRRSQPLTTVPNPQTLEEMMNVLANFDPRLRQLVDIFSGRAPLPPRPQARTTTTSTSSNNNQATTAAPDSAEPMAAPEASTNESEQQPVAASGVVLEPTQEPEKKTTNGEGPAIVDTPSLLTLLHNYIYEPMIVKDRRTSFRLFLNLSSNGKTRLDLLNILLVVLEKCPSDLIELNNIFDTFVNAKLQPTSSPVLKLSVPSRPASVNNAIISPISPSDVSQPFDLKRLVFVQRTLQLLMYLVNHSQVMADFFVREDQDINTTASLQSHPQSANKKQKRASKLPLILLFMALENPFINQQPLLMEYLMHLIALIVKQSSATPSSTSLSSPSTAGKELSIPPVFLHTLVKSLQTAAFSVKGALYATQCFTLLARKSPSLAIDLLVELSEQVHRMLSRTQDLSDADLARLLRIFKILNGMANELPKNDVSDFNMERVLATLSLDTFFNGWLHRKLEPSPGPGDESVLMAVEIYFLHEKLMSTLTGQTAVLPSSVITFSEKHRQLINDFIRQQPTLLLGPFSRLSILPRLLEFDNKRIFFKSQLHKKTTEREQHMGTMSINVRRAFVFEDSFQAVMSKRGEDFRYARLNVKFHGEEGVDAGGVTREWFSVLSRAMFNPDYALFKTSAGDKITYQPNRQSSINPDHLQYFRFVGRIIAKAINDNRLLDCYFTRAFYKQILGRPLDLSDLEAVDPDFYKSMQWVLDNDISNGVLGDLTFCVEVEDFGEKQIVDLKSNGRNILVDEGNKREYVQLVSEYKLSGAVATQMEAFLKGFFEIIPKDLIAVFDEQELELLISGMPDIEVDDWKNNTEYHNAYTVASPQIQWFWRCVRAMTLEERAKLIQFVTGTSKVPLEGFAHLQGSNGRQRFQIHRDCGGTNRLPSAHTCFNQLDLPEYESYEQLRDALKKAIGEYGQGFGLA